jgi:chromosome partitioning protein
VLLTDSSLGATVQPTNFANLQIIPADDGLKGIKSGQTQIEGGELRLRSCLTRIRGGVDQLNDIDQVDWILIDCPPSLDRLTMNALAASDYVLVPVDPGAGGRGALGDTMSYIYSAQKWYNPTLRVLGLLINNTDPRTIYDQTTEEVVREMYGDLVFETVITASVRVRESAETQIPLVFYESNEFARHAQLYQNLSSEVLQRVG